MFYCVPTSPDCVNCPLQTWCQAYSHNTVSLLPVRKPRPKIRDRYFNYTIYITPDRQTLLHQRQEKDIWQHLWEFPLVESNQLLPAKDAPFVDFTHQLSHQRLHARFTLQPVTTLPDIPQTKVVHISDIDDFALSRLTLKAMEYFGL